VALAGRGNQHSLDESASIVSACPRTACCQAPAKRVSQPTGKPPETVSEVIRGHVHRPQLTRTKASALHNPLERARRELVQMVGDRIPAPPIDCPMRHVAHSVGQLHEDASLDGLVDQGMPAADDSLTLAPGRLRSTIHTYTPIGMRVNTGNAMTLPQTTPETPI